MAIISTQPVDGGSYTSLTEIICQTDGKACGYNISKVEFFLDGVSKGAMQWTSGHKYVLYISNPSVGSHSFSFQVHALRIIRDLPKPFFCESKPGSFSIVAPPPPPPPPPVEYTLTISTTVGGATNPAPGQYKSAQGSIVSVTAYPQENYVFDHWNLDGINVSTSPAINVNMNTNHTLEAVFAYSPPPPPPPPPVEYVLTITATAGGTTSPAPGQYATRTKGATVSVTAIPEKDYVFDHWNLDGINVSFTNPITVTMDTSHTLEAFFTPAPIVEVAVAPPVAPPPEEATPPPTPPITIPAITIPPVEIITGVAPPPPIIVPPAEVPALPPVIPPETTALIVFGGIVVIIIIGVAVWYFSKPPS